MNLYMSVIFTTIIEVLPACKWAVAPGNIKLLLHKFLAVFLDLHHCIRFCYGVHFLCMSCVYAAHHRVHYSQCM